MKKVNKEEKFIYCWQCGTKNPKKRWHCQVLECHARLKQHDHPLMYWLFGEIKDDAEDGLIKYISELLINFLKLHLYGVTMGLALAFTIVATVSHFEETKEIELTPNTYYLTPSNETIDTPVDAEPSEDVPLVSDTPVATEKPNEEQKKEPTSTPNKNEETVKEPVPETKPTEEVETKKTCPEGYQMRSDGKCESIAYTDALGFVECESGYDKVNSAGVQSSADTDVYCMSHSPYAAGTRYCPATKDDFIARYGNDSCITNSSSFTGTLSGSNCNYTFYGADGTQTSCSNTYTYQYKCPDGDFFQVDQWCYNKKPTITNYYCLDKTTKQYVLTPDGKCRTIIEATVN